MSNVIIDIFYWTCDMAIYIIFFELINKVIHKRWVVIYELNRLEIGFKPV